jgi:3-oxoacyl-[acyl-carrier protein] reductase
MGKNMSKKTAVVVGATGNLGQAVCESLRVAGFELDEQWLKHDHPDSTKSESYANLPKKIDAAIYVAGVNSVNEAENVTEDSWHKVLDVNLTGAFLFAKAAFSSLKAAGNSSFITISSIMTTHPYPGRLPYAVSKAGLEAMTKSLAVEWGKYGIATHCLRLGHISGLMKSTQTNPKLLENVRSKIPRGKLLDPAEVASYITWLSQGGAQSVSGSIIDFDPAYLINRWPL